MTSLLSRYVAWSLTKTCLATNCVVMSLFFVLTLLERLNHSSIIGLGHGLYDTLLRMPEILYLTIPASCTIGTAVGLALLDSRQEIVTMRLAGVSFAQLARWVGATGLLWVLVHIVVGEVLLPRSAIAALKLQAQQEGSFITSREAVWLRTESGYTSIGRITPDGENLTQVQIFISRDHALTGVTLAAKAWYADGSWQLTDVTTARLENQLWRFAQHDKLSWPEGPSPQFLTSFRASPSKLPVHQLIKLSSELRSLDQSTQAIDLVIWSRLTDAITILLLMTSALTLVRNRTTYSVKHARNASVIALIAMLLYYYCSVITRQLSLVNDWPPALGALMPPIALVLIVLAWLSYQRHARAKLHLEPLP